MGNTATTYRIELDPTITKGILYCLEDMARRIESLEANRVAEDRDELSAAGRRLSQG